MPSYNWHRHLFSQSHKLREKLPKFFLSVVCTHCRVDHVQTPQELQRVLKRITNTHTEIYPVKPTLTQYNVKFSKQWQYAPKINIPLPPNNTIATPLSPTYNHIHPLKYNPLKCIYMDGSFIPPSKNPESQIDGNTAGSRVYSPNKNTQIS